MIRLIPLNSAILTIPNYLYGQGNNNLIILLPYEVFRILQMTWKISGSALAVTRKSKKQSIVLACVYDLLVTFCLEDEYFFFFTWREALFCFQQMT